MSKKCLCRSTNNLLGNITTYVLIGTAVMIFPALGQGWEWQNPTPFGDEISKIYFHDDHHGWMLPQNNTIFRTSDAGQSWEVIYTDLIFSNIQFINPTMGWGIGRVGLDDFFRNVYFTTDGGLTWEAQLSGQYLLQGLTFIDDSTGWAGGRYLFKTTDAGETWQRFPGGETPGRNITDICFYDHDKGWVLTASEWETPRRTTDGGATWFDTDSALIAMKEMLYSDSLHLWSISDVYFGARSTDGGDNWQIFNLEDFSGLNKPGLPRVEIRMSDLFALDNRRIYVGTGNTGLFRSTDGGNNWIVAGSEDIEKIWFVDKQTVWAAGRDKVQRIWFSPDTALSWMEYSTNQMPEGSVSIKSLDFVTPEKGWVIPDFPITQTDNILAHTTDSGNTWNLQELSTNASFHRVYFFDDQHGWLVGDSGKVFMTVDGGIDWQEQMTGTLVNLKKISFVSPTTGWVVGWQFGGSFLEGVVLKTTDGGLTWIDQTPIPNQGFSDVAFVDSLYGWVGYGGGNALDGGFLLHTTDGGNTWITQRQDFGLEVQDIVFVDREYGWLNGYDPLLEATTIHTTDGGNTWSAQDAEYGWDMHFADRLNGWIVGVAGQIYHTTDGGNTWLRQNPYTYSTFNSVDFVDKYIGWVGGHWNSVLHTTTGGEITGIIPYHNNEPTVSEHLVLHQNYPNPFNPATIIAVDLKSPGNIRVDIYNALGNRIKTLFNGKRQSGYFEFQWDGKDHSGSTVASGIYFYAVRLTQVANPKINEVVAKKMLKLH